MKGLFIPGITAKMFRDASLESIAELMAEGKIYDIDYQEPCEDAISRAEALKVVDDINIPEDMSVFEIKSHICVGISTIPPVTLQPSKDCISREDLKEPKMGRWVVVDDEYGDNSICECSECKDRVWMYKSADQKWNYCPNCGLRMESEVQNDRTN